MATSFEQLLTRLPICFLSIIPNCKFSFFPHLGFWKEDFFLIAPFPDHCLLFPFHPVNVYIKENYKVFRYYLRTRPQDANTIKVLGTTRLVENRMKFIFRRC